MAGARLGQGAAQPAGTSFAYCRRVGHLVLEQMLPRERGDDARKPCTHAAHVALVGAEVARRIQ
eukprot:4593867-Prymnesium_polylepis.1